VGSLPVDIPCCFNLISIEFKIKISLEDRLTQTLLNKKRVTLLLEADEAK